MKFPLPSFSLEKRLAQQGYCRIAGVDEAGRGPLAGPVVAAAVILDINHPITGVKDSKQLSPKKREKLYNLITKEAIDWAVSSVSALDIDRLNILQASLKSMEQAAKALSFPPDYLLIDGRFTIAIPIPQQAIIKGDNTVLSISAASIIAKVTRDRIMENYHKKYPWYNFSHNKGYPTVEHKKAIEKYGPSPIHRKSFRGVLSEANKKEDRK